MGSSVTSRHVPLTTPQCCTHWPGEKCIQVNACPCWAVNHPCTSGCPLDHCRNQVRTQVPTATRLAANLGATIEEAQEAAPTLCQAIDLVVFHQDAPAFSPRVLPRGDKWPALLVRADTANAAPELTKTAAPNPAAPAAVGSGKINSNHAQPRDVKTTSPSPPSNQDSDVTLVASIG